LSAIELALLGFIAGLGTMVIISVYKKLVKELSR